MSEQLPVIKAADLVTPGGGEGGNLVDAVLLPVDGGRAKVFGLFSVTHENQDIRDAICRVMRTHLDLARNAMASDTNIARRFETALTDLNASLAEVAAEAGTFPVTQFEAVIGVVTDHQLFTSGLGNLNALFLHKTAERRFVIYELHAQFRTDAESTWEKPFVTILDGEIHPGDIFYVATRTPASTIALADLQDVLITLPPAGALQRIRQFLPHDATYGALCFTATEEDRSGPPKKTNPIASIAQLGDMKSETADLLGEQGTNITGFIRRGVALISGKLASPGSRGYKSMLKRLTRLLVQILGVLLVGVMQGVKTVATLLITLVRRIFDASRGRGGDRRGGSGDALRVNMTNRVNQLRNMPRSSKYVIGGIAGIVILLVVSISYMGNASERRKTEDAFKTTVSRVEEKTSAAEASLIYNDTDKARTLLTEAAALLETLPTNNGNHQSQIAELSAALTTLQAKIRKITLVEPSTVAELGSDEAGLATLVGVQGTLFAFALDADVFRVNELEHAITKQAASNGAINGVHTAAEEGANIIFIDSGTRLGRVDMTANTLKPITSGVEGMASAEDVVSYNSAIYVLSAASQQITKMRVQGDGYEAGTPWISARSSDLTGARAIAIDGSVFVLTATDVVQYKSGREVTWDHDAAEPALKNPIDIWTSVDSSYLYILDSGEGRVIVYDKTSGNIATQYASDTIKGSIGFVVRESDKQILIALPGKVVTFTATHLLQ